MLYRTYFSLLRGCVSPEEAVDRAAARGMKALGILDRLNFYGIIRFVNACVRRGIRPVGGMDISADPAVPVAVLFSGRRGFAALNRLVTALDDRGAGDSTGAAAAATAQAVAGAQPTTASAAAAGGTTAPRRGQPKPSPRSGQPAQSRPDSGQSALSPPATGDDGGQDRASASGTSASRRAPDDDGGLLSRLALLLDDPQIADGLGELYFIFPADVLLDLPTVSGLLDKMDELMTAGTSGLAAVVGSASRPDPVRPANRPESAGSAVTGPDSPGAAAGVSRGPAPVRPPEGFRRESGAYRGAHVFIGLFDGAPQRRALRAADALGVAAAAVIWGSWESGKERSRIDLLRAIDLNVPLKRLPAEERTGDFQRVSADGEARGQFALFDDARRNGRELARLDASFLVSGGYVFPDFEGMDDGATFEHLRGLCLQGVRRRFGGMRPDIASRLEYELNIIRAKGFASYFLVVHDIVSRTPRTCGRGSSAASIVSYCLGITHVDPLKYNLFFERFLNMGRTDPPDIDVDFPWDERADTLRYVFARYPGRSAMVADHVTFGPRSSIREPAKAMGIDEEEISRFIRLWKLGQGDRLPEWLRREATAIRGIPRYLGTHPGGVVITPGPLSDWAHCQTSPLGWPVIAWEKDAAEDAGLVKIDILGNRSLGVLRDCIGMINDRCAGGGARHSGGPLSWEGLNPLEDRRTREFIEAGDTLGVFYVESPATRQLLQEMRTGDYPHLVIASSIIRPAANRFINEYVRRLHGHSWEPIDPRAEAVLEETLGIMVYQEDVSRVAIAVSGFSPAEADRLRKVLSRKDRDLKLESWRQHFIAGGRDRGGEPAALEELWEMVRSFEGYSFCKPHSASYALVSYKLAWIKRHYPLEFYTAVINNGGGYYTRQTYVNAARRLGHPVLLPDVNRGYIAYAVDYGPADRGIGPSVLRAGLMQIKGLSLGTMERVVQERSNGGDFRSFRDFYLRIRPDILQTRALIRSGALDSIDPALTRPAMFWVLASLRRGLLRSAEGKAGDPAAGAELFDIDTPPEGIGDYTPGAKLRDEAETLGIFLTVHPLEIFLQRGLDFARRNGFSPHINSAAIPDCLDRKVYISGYMVSGKEVRTRQQQSMSFITFEDRFGIFETVFFPGAYQSLIEVLDSSMVFLIHGTVRQELGAFSIHCINLFPLSRRYSRSRYFSDSFYTMGDGGKKGDRKAG